MTLAFVKRAALAACAIPLLLQPLSAQDPGPTETPSLEEREDNVLRMLQEERAKGVAGKGLLMIDVAMRGSCGLIDITIAHRVEGKLEPIHVRGSITNREGKTSFHGIRTVPAGDYVVAAVMCQVLRDKFTQVGPHARFQVRAGEFVDVGTLHLSHTKDPGFFSTTGTSQRAVQPTSPEKLAHFKSKFPNLMSRRVARQMALAGPAESKTKQKLPW
jgi:hypothetical protein